MTTENFETKTEQVEAGVEAGFENAEQLQEAAKEAVENITAANVSPETAQAEAAKAEEIKGVLSETLSAEGGVENNEKVEEGKQKLEAYDEMLAFLKGEIAAEEAKTGFFAKMGSSSRIASLKKDMISVKNQKNIEEDYKGTNPASIIRQTKNLKGFDLKKYPAIKDKGGIMSANTHTFGGGA